MSFCSNKLFKSLCCACKSFGEIRNTRKAIVETQKRLFNHYEKASGRIQIGVLGAPIESGQVDIYCTW